MKMNYTISEELLAEAISGLVAYGQSATEITVEKLKALRSVPVQISVSDWPTKAVICEEPDCTHKRECANHTTAGDFRIESGLTPLLSRRDGRVWCSTKHCDKQNLILGTPCDEDYNCILWSQLKPVDSLYE